MALESGLEKGFIDSLMLAWVFRGPILRDGALAVGLLLRTWTWMMYAAVVPSCACLLFLGPTGKDEGPRKGGRILVRRRQ